MFDLGVKLMAGVFSRESLALYFPDFLGDFAEGFLG